MWLSLLLAPPAPRASARHESLSAVLRRDGFVVIRRAVPRDVCAAVRAELEAELGADDPPGGEDRRVNIPLGCAHAGFDLLEVEFPPLSTEVLEDGAVDAYTISKENIKLACAVGEALRGGRRGLGKVALMLPDKAELDRAVEDEGTDEPSPGITIHNLREDLLASAESPADVVLGLFGVNREARVKPVEGAELYICLVFSAQELPDLESLRKLEQAAGRKPAPIIAFNLKLDTLRADRFSRAVTWVVASDDVTRAFLVSAGWDSDGAHRELDLDGTGAVTLKQVRLHTALV